MHLDLVVPRKGIQEAEQPATRGVVYQSIDAWQGVGVLRAGLVKVGEVYAHPPLPVGFLH